MRSAFTLLIAWLLIKLLPVLIILSLMGIVAFDIFAEFLHAVLTDIGVF